MNCVHGASIWGALGARPLASWRVERSRVTRTRPKFSRGMTLIEILVVMFIIVILTSAIVLGSGQTSSARLRQSSALVTGAIRVAYSRASSMAKPVRLVMDFEHDAIILEESEGAMMVQSRDTTGTGGAAAATGAEQLALKEGERIMAGVQPPRPTFRPVEEASIHTSDPSVKGARKLPAGITFRSVQSGHDDAPRTDGRAYLYFWPGGQTEQAVIQLAIGKTPDDTQILTLVVAPLTGRVTIKNGAVALHKAEGEKELQEREAPGGF